jgi:hypothetical protein
MPFAEFPRFPPLRYRPESLCGGGIAGLAGGFPHFPLVRYPSNAFATKAFTEFGAVGAVGANEEGRLS